MPKPEEKIALGEVIKNHLFDLDGPKQVRNGPWTGERLYFSRIFYGFTEIFDSLEMLDDILFFTARFPYSNTRISRERYLQFLVEAYFGEVYILQERLKQYLRVIERLYKTDPNHSEIRKTCKNLQKLIADVLGGVLQVRNNHVHYSRFSEKGLDRLKSIGLLANNTDGEFGQVMKMYYRSEHVKIRAEWRERVKTNNEAIRRLVDAVSKAIHRFVFDESTRDFKYPAGLK